MKSSEFISFEDQKPEKAKWIIVTKDFRNNIQYTKATQTKEAE